MYAFVSSCHHCSFLCVTLLPVCVCTISVFVCACHKCACMECNIPVWLCEFVPVCTCVCVCAHCIVYGISVFVCLHGLQHSKLVMCVSVCTEWCISQAFCMPEWIAVFQFSCVCLCMCLCTLHGVHHRCLFVVACMDCNIPIWLFACVCLCALHALSFQIQFSCICVRTRFQLNRHSVSVTKHTPRYKRTQEVCSVTFYFHPGCRIVLPSIHSRSGKMGHSL